MREVLNEVKANGVGDNKNVLIELNIEQTRHNEIQLLGNGEWCISLGGRDCSLQMHEQKLLEVSVTQEGLMAAIEKAKAAGRKAEVKALESDLKVLARMEEESARFGQAVGLDSASTFECIVDRDRHFFMEVNTRIQVEHRVTELCYSLKFTNPKDKKDFFIVESLVEAMALLARHKERLPKPERVVRFNASVEARLNATDASLSPHAGGMIRYWSKPIKGEVRDDQGISMTNPDTGIFMKYKVAGAYDSNIALLLTKGDDRLDSYERLSDVLRSTTLRGSALATNLEFHYGLVNWFLGRNVMAKPTTRFVVPYLALVGTLKEEANKLDVVYAFFQMKKHYAKLIAEQYADQPDVCRQRAEKHVGPARPQGDPDHPPHGAPAGRPAPALRLAEHQHQELPHREGQGGLAEEPAGRAQRNLRIPAHELTARTNRRPRSSGTMTTNCCSSRCTSTAPCVRSSGWSGMSISSSMNWSRRKNRRAALTQRPGSRSVPPTIGYEAGLELLGMLFLIGENTKFWDMKVLDDLEVVIPDYLTDLDLQARMKKILVPPPATKADEIVAVCGGMYYGQEAPGLPPFVTEGMHFEKGQPLYIIEVMKMFNTIRAPFSGTIDKIIMEGADGTIVQKGQPLFKITPDEKFVEVDQKELEREKRECTGKYLKAVL